MTLTQKKTAEIEAIMPSDALAMLAYQVIMGADEALLDMPFVDDETPAFLKKETPQKEVEMVTDWGSVRTLDELRDLANKKLANNALRKTATNMVFSDGNPDADIMLVGEAPGADEDRQGKPFVGASGQLLDKMLASIGLNRKNVYISNIILWRPPGNRTPTTEEVQMFLPIIHRHIQLVNPKILVALGGSSGKALLNTNQGILKLRSQWLKYNLDDGKEVPIIAMLHPAYLLRTPNQKALSWQDLRKLRRKWDEIREKGA